MASGDNSGKLQTHFRNFQPLPKTFPDVRKSIAEDRTESNPDEKIRGEQTMKFNFWNGLFAAALAITMLLSLGQTAAAQPRVDKNNNAKGLIGTWAVQVQLVDCVSGTPLGSPFPSLLTFAAGGVETDTTANPMFYPAERSPGHGVWSRVDTTNFSTASSAFITLNGALTKTQKITQAIHMDDSRDSFSSIAGVDFYDPAGNLLASACATATAQRFK
jgi:hypothetical protein